MPQVVPFPLVRRTIFIDKQGLRAARLSQKSSERYIQLQLKIQRESMRRKGIAEDVIIAELQGMESAVRTAIRRAFVSSGAV